MSDHRSLPLTDISEDEKLFQDTVRSFADEKIRPLVSKMDQEAKMPRDLIDACFELGLMGIELPENYGGAGSTFFMYCACDGRRAPAFIVSTRCRRFGCTGPLMMPALWPPLVRQNV